MPRRTVLTKTTQKRAASAERQATKAAKTHDSFQNFALNLGMGTNNALTGSTYGFNPITRNRTLLEWIHRGSWFGKMVCNTVAEDMVRAGIDIQCDAKPEDVDGVQQDMVSTGTWTGLENSVAWGRLYGGALGVMQIEGQDYSTPLDVDRIGRNQFRGVLALDRWLVEPSLNDLVSEPGPDLGMPKCYRVTSDFPGLRMKIIHHSRVIRFVGSKLPYWQQVSENLWGASVIESMYDRMIAFDSATQGAAQLAYKAYLRTIKIDGLREIIAAGGEALQGLFQFVEMMRMFQGIEGVTMLDAKDEFEGHSSANFAGLSDVMLNMAQQLSGASQIPLVRLFGQSPAGLNSTGESDLRTYYDGINQKQVSTMSVGMKKIVWATAQSGGWKIPEDFTISFRPLWQLSEEQKSEVAAKDTSTVTSAEQSGLVSQKVAMKELKSLSKVTGRWTNITDEDIADASEDLPPRGQEAIDQETDAMADRSSTLEGDEGENDPKDIRDKGTTRDRTADGPNNSANAGIYHLGRNGNAGAKPSCGQRGAHLCGSYKSFAEEPEVNRCVKCDAIYKGSFAYRSAQARDSMPVSQICGLDVGIENPRGTIRRGRSEDGTAWETVMPADYGYIRRAPSAEGQTEWLDCFVGPVRTPDCPVHVIDGYEPLGRFDEHKVMLGFPSRRAAIECYHTAYGDGRRAGDCTTMTADELREWFTNGDVTKPCGTRNLRLAAGAQ